MADATRKTVVLYLRVPADLKDRVQAYAASSGLSDTAAGIDIIRKGLLKAYEETERLES